MVVTMSESQCANDEWWRALDDEAVYLSSSDVLSGVALSLTQVALGPGLSSAFSFTQI